MFHGTLQPALCWIGDGPAAADHADVPSGVALNEQQRKAIVAFLKSLCGAVPKIYGPPEVAAAETNER